VLIDSTITGILGVISIAVVFYIREGKNWGFFKDMKKHLKAYIYVFIILFLFTFAQESSGFNRYRAEADTANGKGPYAEIDGTAVNGVPNVPGMRAFRETEKPGDYFMTSVSYTCGVIIALACFYFIFRMFGATFRGMNSHQISDAFNSNASFKFFLEIMALAVINGVAPMISSKLRGEKMFGKSTMMMTGVVVVVSIVLHFMFQWSGVYAMGGGKWTYVDFMVIFFAAVALSVYMGISFGKK
jgi:hypothetical protein